MNRAELWMVVAVVLMQAFCGSKTTMAQSQVGKNVSTFELKDTNNQTWELSKGKHYVVAFMGVECPLVKLYAARLQQIQDKVGAVKVEVVGVNSNQQDSIAELQHFVRTYGVEFKLLKDPGNRIADQFEASRTPEVFLLNNELQVVYHGAIDDQYTYGVQKAEVKNHYLRDALERSLARKEVALPYVEPVGCIIAIPVGESN